MADNILLNFIEKAVKKFSSFEDSYEIQKLIEKEQNKENVFGFWSPFDGVGKTTALVNVAYEIAKKGNTVCVVDLNMLLPDAFRYLKHDFELNKKEEVKSIREKLINLSLPISEFITKTKYPNIALLTPLFTEHPSVYCLSETSAIQEKRMMDIYIGMFKELGELYDYVLLDVAPSIIDISTISAFRSCDNIITFIGHYPKSIEYTMKTIKIFGELGLFGVFDHLVQGPIYTETWTEAELRVFNPNANLITNIPFSNEVNVAGNNLDIFVSFNKSSNKAALMYRESITKIVVTLQHLAKQSKEKNEREKKEALKNAKIVMEGIKDYIADSDIDVIEIENDAFIAGIIEAANISDDNLIELSEELILTDENELNKTETEPLAEAEIVVENIEDSVDLNKSSTDEKTAKMKAEDNEKGKEKETKIKE